MSGKNMRHADRYKDADEGTVHFSAPSIAVNSGLCGNNDPGDETDDAVDCRVCLAIVEFVASNGRQP